MSKLVFNTRDELWVVDTERIAVIQANGNYSRIVYINKRELMLTMGITRIEEAMANVKNKKHKFIRLGRSLIVNHSYLQKIDMLKQQLVLSDGVNDIRVSLSKRMLKSYKDAIVKSLKIKNDGKANNSGNGGDAAVQD